MRYMLLMYADPARTAAMSASEREEVGLRHGALGIELTESGTLLNGAGLAYPAQTVVLRMDGDTPATIEGPLSDAVEQLTAFYVVDCDRQAAAISIAERLLDLHVTAVEVRQVHDSFGMGAPDPRA